MDLQAEHATKCAAVATQLADARARGACVRLGKSTTNLFRRRNPAGVFSLDVGRFTHVLNIDRARLIADVEGMIPYDALVDQTLAHGLVPAVVPELKSITVGGAISGVGIESSSFRFGLVHQTVEEMEVLLADGRIAVCSPDLCQDLFYGFPNSYGTLGYVLRARIQLAPAMPYVQLEHTKFSEPDRYFERIAELCGSAAFDYLDGTVFHAGEMYLTAGRFSRHAPRVSNYTYMRMYYKSIQRKREDWLSTRDYIWRWDTDWFWCSKHFHVQNPLLRLLVTPRLLNSRTYHRVMRLSQKVLPAGTATETVVQDVQIPIENASAFLRFLLTEVGITPVWVCPFRSNHDGVTYDLYRLEPGRIYINFGFWDTVAARNAPGDINRSIEGKACELGGRKALYSTVWYDEETFWQIYNGQRYHNLKAKYDPGGVFPDLYLKCTKGR